MVRFFFKRLFIFAFCMAGVIGAPAILRAGDPTTPAQGSAERKALMDALRIPVEGELHTAVVFKVDHLKVLGDWAFLRGAPQRPDGKKIDYRGTRYAGAIEAGAFDNGVCALLHLKSGQWQVVQYVIGATDVPYEDWPQKYGAPPSIFR